MKILTFFLLLLPFTILAKIDDPTILLQKSDAARGGLNDGVSWTIKIVTVQNNETSESYYKIKVKNQNILAVCFNPPRLKDETFLFNDKNLWIYKPNLKKPISVSSRQRLSGQTANGDIAAINYSKDYIATFLKEEKIDNQMTAKLLLKAKSSDSTYDKIHYWVSLSSGLAIKADYLNFDDTPMKTSYFTYQNSLKGKAFISKMEIIDSQFSTNKSTLFYESISEEKLSDSIFNVNNLSR